MNIRGVMLRGIAACAIVVLAGIASLSLAGCACSSDQVATNVTDDSPQLTASSMSATSTGDNAETAQRIDVVLSSSETLEATGDIASDFTVLLNGEPVDGKVIKLDVTCDGDAVTFSLTPGEDAQGGPGAGDYFAVYQGQISISSARDDGALPHLTSASGATAVLPEAVEGTLPSGLTIEVMEQTAGSEADGTAADTVFAVSSPATVRAITWLSLDGGQTKLLKHNHTFATSDEEACAENLVEVINQTDGYVARAHGAMVEVRATEVVDGQVIDPVIVEGFGVTGGEYDGSEYDDSAE